MELIRQRLGKWGKALLALTLALGLIPSAAFANPASTIESAAVSEKADYSTPASSDLVAGTYVEGEALVVYRDSSASNARMRGKQCPVTAFRRRVRG